MSKLIVTDANGATKEVPLNKERVTIGRAPDNDIPFPGDKAVSGHHAVVITILQDSFLEDLDSTNGTQVNGKQVAKHPLSNGDVIMIGRNSLKYQGEGGGEEDDFEKTMIIRPGQMGAAFDANVNKAAPAAPAPPATPMVGKLKVASGPNAGKELVLTKALTTLGRPGDQVAAITRRADGYYIVHVGAQGPEVKRATVNGEPVGAQARLLKKDDVVELLGVKMRFYLVTQP